MGAIYGRHSGFWILLIWSLEFASNNVCSGLLEVYEKECQGTETRFSHTHMHPHERYEEYRRLYENCTLIRDNLEITFIQLTDPQYDFSFLETIREVNGYVLIAGNYVDRIRLNGLRVIRGWKTFQKLVGLNNATRSLSLYVGWNYNSSDDSIGLKELQLTSLVEILKGDVYFDDNAQLCFPEKSINWTYIKQNNRRGEIIIDSSEKKRACDGTCHESCTIGDGRFCWGEGPDMCQAERPCMTCRRNCSGNNCFCKSECIGGCTGSDETSCMGCKHFLKSDRCVENCNELHYNQRTHEWEPTTVTYMLGNKCVAQCPENMLIQNDACVAKCLAGYMENKASNEKKCVHCKDGICPKTCIGTELWLHGDSLAQFNQCTKVEGSLKIKDASFVGHVAAGPAAQLADLEILKDIEEITGVLDVNLWHPNLTSLSFLRNLRVIGGIGSGRHSLKVMMTPLETLDLKSLRQIKKGGVVIYRNANLCYAHTINWTRILTSKDTAQEILVTSNANSSTCEEQGRTCSELCSDFGCWGPGDDNCVSCLNYSMNGRCVTNCTMQHGFYSFTTEDGVLECGRCHEECLLGCTGDGPDKCKSCRHVNDNGVCLPECPADRYSDLNGTCQWCDGRCKGCTGNSSHLGQFGCNNCQQGLLLIKSENEKYCLQNETECDKTHFWSNEFVETSRAERVPMRTCRKCHPECNRCENGSKSTDCIKCHNYKQKISSDQEIYECVSNCSYDNGYYYIGNSVCMPCAPVCKICKGPTKYDYDCQRCKDNHYRIHVSPTEEDLGNNTSYKSFCDKRCPSHQPNTNRNANDTESYCSHLLKSESALEHKSTVTIFVALFLVIVIVIVIVVLGVVWRKQKQRRLREIVVADEDDEEDL